MKMKDFGYYRGIDLGGWFSQCDYSQERLDHFITLPDLDRIAGWGLDHVRIPVDYNVLEKNDGSPLEEGYTRIRRVIDACRERGLKVVFDLHKTAGFSFDADEKEAGFFESEKYQERFLHLWEEIAKRFNEPDHVAFELLNEVTDASFIGTWNRVSAECIKRIRGIAPETLILIGSYHNNSAAAVKDLEAPADGKVIYNFHCYSPLPFTHQGAHWVPELDINARVSFEEAGITPELFEAEFMPAIRKAEENNTCLYCGEYGVIEHATPEDTVKWFAAIHEVFEKYGISRAAWSYKQMDFGLGDARLDGVRDRLIPLL